MSTLCGCQAERGRNPIYDGNNPLGKGLARRFSLFGFKPMRGIQSTTTRDTNMSSKFLAATVGVAFVALGATGCATQQSGEATVANLPTNCAALETCKGRATCKVHSCKGTKVYKRVYTNTPPVAPVDGGQQ